MAEGEHPAKSPLAEAIESNKPKAYPFAVQGMFGLGQRPIRKVAIHAPRKGEDEAAVKEAVTRIDEFSEGNETLKNDPDLTNDAKAMAIIQRAVWTEDEKMQAFPGVAWMRQHFTGNHVGQLINLINEVRVKEAGIDWGLSAERIDATVQLCVRAASTDIPERVLSQFQREYLTSLVVLLCLRIYELSRPGVEVVKDEDGNLVIRYADGDGPEWEALPEGIIDDPDLDESVAAAFAEDHERDPD